MIAQSVDNTPVKGTPATHPFTKTAALDSKNLAKLEHGFSGFVQEADVFSKPPEVITLAKFPVHSTEPQPKFPKRLLAIDTPESEI